MSPDIEYASNKKKTINFYNHFVGEIIAAKWTNMSFIVVLFNVNDLLLLSMRLHLVIVHHSWPNFWIHLVQLNFQCQMKENALTIWWHICTNYKRLESNRNELFKRSWNGNFSFIWATMHHFAAFMQWMIFLDSFRWFDQHFFLSSNFTWTKGDYA